MTSEITSLLNILQHLIASKTMAPPARNTKPLQQWIASFLESNGFQVDQVPFYKDDLLLSAVKKGESSQDHHSLLLNGHIDVAPVDFSAWHSDPFKLTQQGDRLIGRGVSDMKGGMACFLLAIKKLHDQNVKLPGDLKFQSVVGEELGEAGTKKLLKRGDKADFAIIGDTSDMTFEGQGGVITGWIILKSPTIFHDGNRVKMVSTGGGLKGTNMIEKMMIVIHALNKLERYWGITKKSPGFLPGTDTINPAYINGGIHPAFVPNKCRLWITVHFYPEENVHTIVKEIEQTVTKACSADPWLDNNLPIFKWGGDSMLVDKGEFFPPLPLQKDLKPLRLLAQLHQKVVQQTANFRMSTSVSDSGWFNYFHIPAIDYGPGQMLQAHSNNEEVSLQQLLNYEQVIFKFIQRWCTERR